jgi:hypothetical protein
MVIRDGKSEKPILRFTKDDNFKNDDNLEMRFEYRSLDIRQEKVHSLVECRGEDVNYRSIAGDA